MEGRKIGLLVAALAFSTAPVSAAIITEWDFNGTSSSTVPGGSTSPTASIGTGTAALLNGVTGSFSSGIANGGSSDPVVTSPNNFGWQTTTYAAQGADSGMRGVEFAVSTVGYSGISVEFDTRHSNTSSRFVQLQYTTDGSTWLGSNTFEATLGGDTWYNNRTANLTADTNADNNALFKVRLVTVFDPSLGNAYSASTGTSTYAATGTLRWDMVQVNGTAVPEPSTLVGLLAAGGCLLALRRRRS